MIVFFDSKEKGLQYTNNVKELPPVKEEIDNDDTLDIGAPVAQLPQRRRRR